MHSSCTHECYNKVSYRCISSLLSSHVRARVSFPALMHTILQFWSVCTANPQKYQIETCVELCGLQKCIRLHNASYVLGHSYVISCTICRKSDLTVRAYNWLVWKGSLSTNPLFFSVFYFFIQRFIHCTVDPSLLVNIHKPHPVCCISECTRTACKMYPQHTHLILSPTATSPFAGPDWKIEGPFFTWGKTWAEYAWREFLSQNAGRSEKKTQCVHDWTTWKMNFVLRRDK